MRPVTAPRKSPPSCSDCGEGGGTRLARELREAFRREHCGLFVAHVEQTHIAALHRGVIEREDVATRQREKRVDAVGAQRVEREIPAVAVYLTNRTDPVGGIADGRRALGRHESHVTSPATHPEVAPRQVQGTCVVPAKSVFSGGRRERAQEVATDGPAR